MASVDRFNGAAGATMAPLGLLKVSLDLVYRERREVLLNLCLFPRRH
jgi:hypothetical protein